MGNSQSSRTNISAGIAIAGWALSPFTFGVSGLAGFVVMAVREEVNNNIHNRDAPVRNWISQSSPLRGERIVDIEVRYCHINKGGIEGPLLDAGGTLAARGLGLTTQALHHHFVIATLETGTYIYLDKHGYRNIRERPNKCGLNGAGDDWMSSELLKRTRPTRNGGVVTLADLIDYAERDQFGTYHLLDDNCQHFAEALYQWI